MKSIDDAAPVETRSAEQKSPIVADVSERGPQAITEPGSGRRSSRDSRPAALREPTSGRRAARLALAPIVCLGLAFAVITHPLEWNEYSHYAQVRAFNAGTPIIDAYASQTGDRAVYHGHFYSDKAPGLSLLMTPIYRVATSIGLGTASDIQRVQVLVVFGCLIPLLILLFAVSRLVGAEQPGTELAAPVMLGLGTLLLPFSTLFFSHLLAACLGFVAYYLLWIERRLRGEPLLLVVAGAMAGAALSTEYPLALVAIILGAYALARPPRARRGTRSTRAIAYGGGVLIGLTPLLAYNWWAFGSPTHLSYASVAANQAGAFGLVGFSPHAALELLFGARGLITVTPVTAAAVVGLVILYRQGRRLEAGTAAAVGVAYLVYNASYYLPLGGWTPGPRFLIPVIPFLALPLAAALRRLPVLTLTFGVVSAATMIGATLTEPELPTGFSTSVWWQRLGRGEFFRPGSAGRVVWFAVFVVLALSLAAWLTPRIRIRRHQVELAALGLLGWILVARAGHPLLGANAVTGDIALALLVLAVVTIVRLWPRRNAALLFASALLLAFLLPALDRNTVLASVLATASLGLVAISAVAAPRTGSGGLRPL